jgi:hypothetical protein
MSKLVSGIVTAPSSTEWSARIEHLSKVKLSEKDLCLSPPAPSSVHHLYSAAGATKAASHARIVEAKKESKGDSHIANLLPIEQEPLYDFVRALELNLFRPLGPAGRADLQLLPSASFYAELQRAQQPQQQQRPANKGKQAVSFHDCLVRHMAASGHEVNSNVAVQLPLAMVRVNGNNRIFSVNQDDKLYLRHASAAPNATVTPRFISLLRAFGEMERWPNAIAVRDQFFQSECARCSIVVIIC